MSETALKTSYCDHRERLVSYMSQTKKALMEAQETPMTDMHPLPSKRSSSFRRAFGTDLLAAATAWKRARLSYEKHIREHGCSTCSDGCGRERRC